ncbi:MBL fold metallo-hydrolase [bacterium]|nr:MBL fold metallo-hydrolase [bacterium]
MELAILASGSKGNATLISTADGGLLIDNGLSCRELYRRLEMVELNPASIQALFVTHEHSDHIKGVGILARKMRIPVYIKRSTLAATRNIFRGDEDIRILEEHNEVCGLVVSPLQVAHDVVDPCAFLVSDGRRKLAVITDLGFPTKAVQHELGDLDALVIESNHCPAMLRNGPYPWFLKQRISGRHGHLSNIQTGEMLREHLGEKARLVYLAHLSEQNNEPELALATAQSYLEHRPQLTLKVAGQYEPSATESIL